MADNNRSSCMTWNQFASEFVKFTLERQETLSDSLPVSRVIYPPDMDKNKMMELVALCCADGDITLLGENAGLSPEMIAHLAHVREFMKLTTKS